MGLFSLIFVKIFALTICKVMDLDLNHLWGGLRCCGDQPWLFSHRFMTLISKSKTTTTKKLDTIGDESFRKLKNLDLDPDPDPVWGADILQTTDLL